MGSLSSRPNVPSQPTTQVVYVPQTPTTTTSTSTPTTNTDASIDEAQNESEVRASNLLQRNRGRFGTIKTGFRGLLELANTSARRTLLGE